MTNLNEEVKTEEKVKAKPGPKPKEEKNLLVVDVTEELKNGKIVVGANRGVGYVTKEGKLYKCGFKNKVVHVDWKGNLVLPKCPACKHRNTASEAVKGYCEKCGHEGEEDL